MDVELLVVPDCPHEKSAALLLRSALDDIGLTAVNVELTVIATEEDAQRRGFVGSPTILLNGIDPFEVPGQLAAVACRLYSGAGGLPDLRALRKALKRAALDTAPQ
jgi:glutaredoxin